MRRVLSLVLLAGCSFPRPADVAIDGGASDAAAVDGAISDGAIDDAAIDGPPDDAAIDSVTYDAAIPEVVENDVPLRVLASTSLSLHFTIHGAAQAHVGWTITPAGGAFDQLTGAVDLDGSGAGTITVGFDAPAATADLDHALALDGRPGTTAFTTRVRTPMALGDSASFPDSAGLSSSPNYLYGQPLTLASPVVVMRLGMYSDAGGAIGRVAIYTDVGGAPSALAIGTATGTVSMGKTELDVTAPKLLPAGSYWIMGNFDRLTPIRRGTTATTPQAYQLVNITDPLPATLTSVATTTNRALNFYAIVVP